MTTGKINILWGGGEGEGEFVLEARKSNFKAKCCNTFVVHCSFRSFLGNPRIRYTQLVYMYTEIWMCLNVNTSWMYQIV